MMAKTNKPLYKLVKEIKDFAGCEFYTDRVDIHLNNDCILIHHIKAFNLDFNQIHNH